MKNKTRILVAVGATVAMLGGVTPAMASTPVAPAAVVQQVDAKIGGPVKAAACVTVWYAAPWWAQISIFGRWSSSPVMWQKYVCY